MECVRTIAWILACMIYSSNAATVNIRVGDSWQDSVDAYPAGTTFRIAAGIHRLQEVSPKQGDSFIGDSGAIMNGSRDISTGWVKESAYWVYQDTSLIVHNPWGEDVCDGPVDAGSCILAEDLYIDGEYVRQVTAAERVVARRIETEAYVESDTLYDGPTWYFDREAKKVYIAFDPAGHKLEIGQAEYAITGADSTVADVTIKNLIIEKYATSTGYTTVGSGRGGRRGNRWTVENNEIRLCHGTGVAVTGPGIIRNNYVHHMGQMGISGEGRNLIVENNIIAYNGMSRVNIFWEAGGTKFCSTDSLIIRHNYATRNWGSALWTDGDNYNVIFAYNRADSGLYGSNGILHEVSYSADIYCNDCRENRGYGISSSHSAGVKIHDNIQVRPAVCRNGFDVELGISVGLRGGVRRMHDIAVYNNDAILRRDVSVCGVYSSGDNFPADSIAARNITFDSNSYHYCVSANLGDEQFIWGGDVWNWDNFITFEELQSIYGQELHGTYDHDLSGSGHAAVLARCAETPGLTGPVGPTWAPTLVAIQGNEEMKRVCGRPAINWRVSGTKLLVRVVGVIKAPITLTLYTVSGRIACRELLTPVGVKESAVDISGLRNGMYLVMMGERVGCIVVRR